MTTAKAEVLIVEDEPEIAELIEFHAERAGMRARTIHSGKLALELIRREKPDVIVLDLMLPDLDGLEVCRRLKQSDDTRGIPIVMVTAYDNPSASVAEEAGVDLVLVGDSGAMTVLGYESTVPVSLDEMLMLAAAARRGLTTPMLIGDPPLPAFTTWPGARRPCADGRD